MPLASANSSRLPAVGLPRQLFARPGEGHDDAGCPSLLGNRSRLGLLALDRCRPECLEVDVRIRHAPLLQRRHQALHHRGGAADVKMIGLERQLHAQQVDVDAAPVMIIAPRYLFRQGIAEAQPQMKIRMFSCQCFEMGLHHQLAGHRAPHRTAIARVPAVRTGTSSACSASA